MLAIVLQKGDDRLLGTLVFQKCKDFKVYLPEGDPAVAEYEASLPIEHGNWKLADEPLTWFLQPGATPDKHFVGRVLRAARRHPDFDVYHVNLTAGTRLPRKVDVRKLFRLILMDGVQAPFSSFIFRTDKLREKAVTRPDGSLDPFPTLLSCAQERPVRNVWMQKLEWTAPEKPQDSAAQLERTRTRLEILRWTESFFGDKDYPLALSDQMALFAKEVARLYPAQTAEELKELMNSFQVSQGPVRKMRAASALKNALKERQKDLQEL